MEELKTSEEIIVQLTMPDEKVYEIKVNQNISFEDVLVKLINETKIMEDKNANDNLFLVSEQSVFGPDKLKRSINSRVEKTSEVLIFKLEALIFDVTNKDYYKAKEHFINLGNIKTQNEQGISKEYEPSNIKNFQPVKQQSNKKKINMMEDIKMSEKIDLKINDHEGNFFCNIFINGDNTVYDVLKTIVKENESKINKKGAKYLALTCKNGESLVITTDDYLSSSLKSLEINGSSEIVISLSQQPTKDVEHNYVKVDYIKNSIKQSENENPEEEKEIKIQEEEINLTDENPQQPQKNVKVTFNFESKENIEVEVSPDIKFNDLVEKFKTEALKKDKNYFKGIDEISFICDSSLISTFASNTSLSEKTKNIESKCITIQVINGALNGGIWDVSDINNKNEIFNDNQIPTSNHENQNSSLSWWRILFFVVGTLLLIAALVVFLVNPELLSLIIPLAVSGGISLLVGFLWNTIKSCFIGSEPKEISNEPMPKENKYDPNKITDLIDPNNNLLSEKGTSSNNGQEQIE